MLEWGWPRTPAEEDEMGKVQINVRVDEALKRAVVQFCRSRGLVLSHFVQEALLDRLEEFEDIDDLKRIRHEPTRPLADVIRELHLDGQRKDIYRRGG